MVGRIVFGFVITLLVSSVIGSNLYTLYQSIRISNATFLLHIDPSLADTEGLDTSKMEYRGLCVSDTFSDAVAIYIADKMKDERVQGQYFQSGVIVILKDAASIDVVSHEVSHFVDHIVWRKGIEDTETRAYLQGYFTECVYYRAQSPRSSYRVSI